MDSCPYRYSVLLRWSEEDRNYVATVPEVPGISSQDETAVAALREVRDALFLALTVMDEDGTLLPTPDVIGRRFPV